MSAANPGFRVRLNPLRILFDDSAARCLDLPALDLAVDAAALRALGRSRRLAPPRYRRRAVHQLLQPRQRILAVAVLTAIALRLDDDHAVGGDALILVRAKARLDRFGQRR